MLAFREGCKKKQKQERNGRRHELLVCIANARRELQAERGDALHPQLRMLANIPPEVVRDFIIMSLP